MTCSRLQHLEITNTDLFTVDFDEGLAPVLAEVGPSLLTLKLDRFRHVDISLVGRLCHRLRTLSLSHIVHFPQLINISEVRDDMNTFGHLYFTEPLLCPGGACSGESIWKLYCL